MDAPAELINKTPGVELHPVDETQNKKAPLWLKRIGTLPDKVSVSFLIVSFHS